MVAIVIVVLIHIALGYALVTGLAYDAVKKAVEKVTTIDIKEPPPPPPPSEPPPPPQKQTAPPPPVAPPPPINVAVAPPPIQTQTTIPPPAPPVIRIPPPAAPVAPPAPPAPSKARGSSVKDGGRWAAQIQANYPSRAVREGTEGTVGVRVTVTPEGRAANCQVTSSSGSSVLDQAACQGIERYGRFNPALNAAGEPISDSYATRIVYKLN